MAFKITEQLAKGKEMASLMLPERPPTPTAEERSRERYRRISLSAVASGGAKGLSILTALISVPLVLAYLGAERYGLWVVMSSTIAMLNFADLGMGNGLINAISEADGKNDKVLAARYVSSAFFMLMGMAIALGVVYVILYPHIPWIWLFNVSSSQAQVEAGLSISVLIGCFLLSLPLGVVQRIQIGYQESFINGLWQGFGNLLGLCAVLVTIHLRANLPWLVLAMAGAPLVATTINGIVLVGARRPWLLPRVSMLSSTAVQKVLNTGFLFFVLQIAGALAYQSDNVVISHFLGASYVPQYAVPMKLFMMVPLLLSFGLSPLWPAYGEAIARHDMSWIRETFLASLKLSVSLSIAAATFLLLLGVSVIHVWVGPDVNPSFGLMLGLALWVVLNGLAGPIAMLLNGTNTIGIQVLCASSMAIANIALSIFLVQRIGVAGPIYGTVISWTLLNLVPLLLYIPRMFASWEKDGTVEVMHGAGRQMHRGN